MNDLTKPPGDTMILRLDVLRVKGTFLPVVNEQYAEPFLVSFSVLGQEHLPQKIARTKFSKRKFYVELKVANTERRTKECEGSKNLEWNEAVTL